MNIIETKKLEQIDSIGIWSQERIMNICARIIMASNEIQKYENVCGDELDVGEDLFTVLQTAAPLYEPVPKVDLGQFPYEGVLNGVIKVYLKSDLEPNSAVIHHGDTGIKLIFVGLLKQLNVEDLISDFIVTRLGINLCSVKSINVDRQNDGQIKEIKIEFIPSTGEA